MNESERRQLHESRLDEQREQRAAYMPTPEEIAAECAKIKAENKAKNRRVKQQPVDDDCDAELERAADIESRNRGRRPSPPNVYRLPEINE